MRVDAISGATGLVVVGVALAILWAWIVGKHQGGADLEWLVGIVTFSLLVTGVYLIAAFICAGPIIGELANPEWAAIARLRELIK